MLQQEALNILKLGKNVFLTGAAGSGKTFLLNQYIKYLQEHAVGVAVTASTGIAATHLNGQTVHSWSGIGVKDRLNEYELEKISSNKRIKKNYQYTKILIIDEISMLHAQQLQMIDQIARKILNSAEAFGGLQVVLCGDFFQLPPVSRSSNASKFAFQSKVWDQADFQICYLSEQHRQTADPLLQVLNAIRSGTAGEAAKIPLRTRYRKDPVDATGQVMKPTIMYAKNINVDALNQRELKTLNGAAKSYHMETKGFSKYVEALKKNCLAPETLELKVGAQVLFVKNAQDGSYVNGTRAIVLSLQGSEGRPVVKTLEGHKIEVCPEDWHYLEYDTVRATLTQIPLRLAWAITIHKSQGMTLDAAEVDLSDAFEPGMGYVALSRVRTLQGLKLMGLNEIALQVQSAVLAHDQVFRNSSNDSALALQNMSFTKKEDLQSYALLKRFAGLKNIIAPLPARKLKIKKEQKISTHQITANLLAQKLTLEEIAKERSISKSTVLSHLEKLKGLNALPDISYIKESIPEADFSCIMHEFKNSEDGKLTPIFEKFNGTYGYDTLQIIRLFVP